MSTSLIVLIPVVLLVMIPVLCFVGCSFHDGSAYGAYEKSILNTANLVAYWPLDDSSGATAIDLGQNNFNGTYTGAVTLNQPGIVPGDQDINNNQNACILVDGGFVNVPFQAALNPQPPFTLEAWVVATWTTGDAPAMRTVVESAVPPAAQGFDLFATPDNSTPPNYFWAAAVGTSSGVIIAQLSSNQPIVLDSLYFLVVTYDGTTLNLWVNPADTSQGPDGHATAPGFAPTPPSIPLFIGTGRPDLPTPQNPFKGFIQDVAFYNAVLDNQMIEQHYANGNGIMMT